MPRRGENIHKRKDGRWEGRYIAGYDSEGKAQYHSVYGSTYTEAKNKLKQNKNHASSFHNSGSMTFPQVCHSWLEYKKVQVKQSTYSNYNRLVKSHIAPFFYKTKCLQMNNEAVNSFIRVKCFDGRLDKTGGLSPKTVADLIAVLKQILLYGEEQGLLPGFGYHLIKPKVQRKELPLLPSQEQGQLIRFIVQNQTLGGNWDFHRHVYRYPIGRVVRFKMEGY